MTDIKRIIELSKKLDSITVECEKRIEDLRHLKGHVEEKYKADMQREIVQYAEGVIKPIAKKYGLSFRLVFTHDPYSHHEIIGCQLFKDEWDFKTTEATVYDSYTGEPARDLSGKPRDTKKVKRIIEILFYYPSSDEHIPLYFTYSPFEPSRALRFRVSITRRKFELGMKDLDIELNEKLKSTKDIFSEMEKMGIGLYPWGN